MAALVENHERRVLVLDSSDADVHQNLTELITGVVRQRVDTLLVTSTTLATIPTAFRSRWKITDVRTLPDSDQYPQISLAGREIRIGDLAVRSDRLIAGEWRLPSPPPGSAWFVQASYRNSRIIIASDGSLLDHLHHTQHAVTAVICNDEEITHWPAALSARVLMAPSRASIFDQWQPSQRQLLIPFHDRSAMTFRLNGEGIEPPPSY